MTAHDRRPGRRTPSHGDTDRPLKVRVQIVTVGGAEGAALRAAQAQVIRELLLWVNDEQHTNQPPDT